MKSRWSACAALVATFAVSSPAFSQQATPKLGLLTYLWGYADLEAVNKAGAHGMELYAVVLSGHAATDAFAFFSQVRYRNSRFREGFPSNVWISQAWVSWQTPLPSITLKAGLLPNQRGLSWDGSFFGNAYYANGLMLDTDYNAELAYSRALSDALALNAWLQISPAEDGLNGGFTTAARAKRALVPLNLEVAPGHRQLLAGRLHVVPTLGIGGAEVSAGATMEAALYRRTQSDTLVGATGVQLLAGGEAELRWRRLRAFAQGDWERLLGFAKVAVDRYYGLLGFEFRLWERAQTGLPSLTAGAALNAVRGATERFGEYSLTPRLTAQLHANVGVYVEYALWRVSTRPDPDFSWANVVLHFNY